jgi:hypothetical protein
MARGALNIDVGEAPRIWAITSMFNAPWEHVLVGTK